LLGINLSPVSAGHRIVTFRSPVWMPPGAVELRNSYGEAGYGGPKPPRGSGPHEYVITLYALKTPSLKMSARATAAQCGRAMEDLILASASTSGFFEQ